MSQYQCFSEDEIKENLTALPKLIGTVLHDIANCALSVHGHIHREEKAKDINLAPEDIEEMREKIDKLYAIISACGRYLEKGFALNVKTPGDIHTFIQEKLSEKQWRWPKIDTHFGVDNPHIRINWTRFKQVLTPTLNYLNSHETKNPEATLHITTSISKYGNLLIKFKDEGIKLDTTQTNAMLRPFIEGIKTDYPIEMVLVAGLNRGSGVYLGQEKTEDGIELYIEVDL